MEPKDIAAMRAKIETIEHVETVLWYDSLVDLSVPMEMLPDKLYEVFNRCLLYTSKWGVLSGPF